VNGAGRPSLAHPHCRSHLGPDRAVELTAERIRVVQAGAPSSAARGVSASLMGPHRKPEEYPSTVYTSKVVRPVPSHHSRDHIGSLKSIPVRYTSKIEYVQYPASGPTTSRGERGPQYFDRLRARVGASSAISHRPCSLNARMPARTHASRPETHLELHDRRADHREQPRRQREQHRRELRAWRTGGCRFRTSSTVTSSSMRCSNT
jgi:hypothetical protein